jgi:hypothetical protein
MYLLHGSKIHPGTQMTDGEGAEGSIAKQITIIQSI